MHGTRGRVSGRQSSFQMFYFEKSALESNNGGFKMNVFELVETFVVKIFRNIEFQSSKCTNDLC